MKAASRIRRWCITLAVITLLAAGAQAATVSLTPADDVWVRGGDYATAKYGIQPTAASYLTVKYEANNPGYTRETFLKFDLRGIPASVQSATLVLTVKSVDTNGQGVNYVQLVNNDKWAEADVSYNTRPTDYAASDAATWTATAANQVFNIDLTSLINNRTDDMLSLRIHGGDNRVVNYYSKDGNTLTQRPRLVITGTGVEAPAAQGRILMEYWTGITGTAVSDLTSNANYPDKPAGRDYPITFEAVPSFADNYGTRFRGYVHAPQTGSYYFYIASDNNSELWLSSDDNPANIGAQPIASVSGYTSQYQWDKYTSQQSAAISLTAGQRYYVEVRHVEATGGDHIEVGWRLPDTTDERPIPGARLSPYLDNEWIPADADIFKRRATAHPRLIASAQTFARLANEMDNDPEMATRFETIIAKADALLTTEVSSYTITAGRLLTISRQVLDRLENLCLAYKFTGDSDYLDRAWDEMNAVAQFPDWHPAHFLDVAEMTMAMALAYDWLYNDLDSTQRATVRTAIKTFGLDPGLAAYQAGVGWATSQYNWSHVCNGGMAVGALAIYEDQTSLAQSILQYVMDFYTLTELCPDGGWSEGAGYWSYAMRYATYLFGAMETNLGSTFGIAGRAGMPAAGFYPIYINRPTGLSFNYGDSGSGGLTTVPEVYFMSKRYNRPEFAAWQRDQYRVTPREILWYDARGQTPAQMNLALDKKFDSCGIAMYRGGWDFAPASFIGIKAGSNNGGHWHLDLGSFVIDALGEDFAVDLGGNNYGTAGVSDYFSSTQRWKYYKVRAEGHNTLVINPDAERDQAIVNYTPIANYVSNSEGAQGIVDLSAAYTGDATSVKRGVRMLDYKRQILVQDELSGIGGAKNVYWFMHTKANIDLLDNGQSAMLTKNGQRLWAHILSAPSGTQFTTMTATPLPTSPVPAGGQDSTVGYQKLVMHITGQSAMTLAVLFVPLSPGESAPGSLPGVTTLANWTTAAYNLSGTGFGASPRPSYVAATVPADWDAEAGQVAFQIYSGVANNQMIPVIFYSENPNTTGADYYWKPLYADWIGWKQFVFPLSAFTAARTPLGWDQLTGIRFYVDGWGATRLSDSVLQAAHVLSVPTGTMFGQLPAETYDLAFAPPEGWDVSKEYVAFDLYSKVANNQAIKFLLMSENPTGVPEGSDYYSYSITANWTGWRHFLIKLSSFSVSRQPRGLDQIDEIRFYTNGWGAVCAEDTLLSLDNFNTAVGGDNFGGAPAASSAVNPSVPANWKPYGSVTFDLYSDVANNQQINVVFHSENTGTPGADYYYYAITADWTGWRTFTIPTLDFTVTGTPLGWNQITGIEFSTTGFGATLLTGTFLSVRNIATTLAGDNFGASPMTVTVKNVGVPANWKPYGYLAFDLYSQNANNQEVMIVASSENAADPAGWDYYSKKIVVNWAGWQRVEIPLTDFGVTRSPLGWDQLDYISFNATGWSMTLLSNTYLSVQNVGQVLEGVNFGASPMTASYMNADVPANWQPYGYLAFDLYSQYANNQEVMIVASSENPTGVPEGWDYYSKKIVVNWTGWQHFEIPLRDFGVSRSPLGWDQLDYIGFRTTGWNMTLLSNTYLSVRNVDHVLEGVNFGATPSPNATAVMGVPADWDAADGSISFSLYSEVNNGQVVGLVCYSENPATTDGSDYYRYVITVNWTGWQTFTVPFTSFATARTPLGWDQLTDIRFHTTGWSQTLLTDTHMSAKDVRSGN